MAEWKYLNYDCSKFQLKVSAEPQDIINEIKDCNEKILVEKQIIKNIDNVLFLGFAIGKNRKELLEQKKSKQIAIRKIAVLESAINALNNQLKRS